MFRNFMIPGLLLAALSACGTFDTTRDFGLDFSPDLSEMKAGIWVDPNGCHHWIIDDGIEGYMSPRRDPKTGKPKCQNLEETGPVENNVIDFNRSILGSN